MREATAEEGNQQWEEERAMTKRLSPERIAASLIRVNLGLADHVDGDLIKDHIDAIEAELAVEKQRGLDLLSAGLKQGAELAEAKVEIARLKEEHHLALWGGDPRRP